MKRRRSSWSSPLSSSLVLSSSRISRTRGDLDAVASPWSSRLSRGRSTSAAHVQETEIPLSSQA